ncbi:type IV-A pilus assembly ATPase PilB [Arenicella xantha]|uniref:Type IV pilus assembly protein PilB n=1 Tax=Arenicella xantha TaxID=644221 RepID=A0A395JLJ4_9GAMM|nr:type IV-A pilus assembly ATPase PilB [Arenicella xantha]RBP49882.1 type IV pilus assembly protein PilB [Arenicella xantha]
MNKPLPALAQTLINLELVSRNDIEEIIVEHKEPRDIVAQINDRGILSSYDLSKQFSDRFGSPLFDMDAFDVTQIPMDHVDMKLVERHMALPLFRRGKNLFVAMFDPTNKSAIDEIKFYTGLQILPIQTELTSLSKAISRIQEEQQDTLDDFLGEGDLELDLGEDSDDKPKDDLDFDPNEAPVVKYVNKILLDAINRGTSDIHIEPFERELRIRFRIDGILHKITTQPISIAPRIVARIKIIAKLDIAERRIPQDGRVKLKISRTKAYDFRVNTLPTVYGEKVVMRILDSSAANLDLTTLGFTTQQLDLYQAIVQRPYGMVLITGPTGSGKTVTLYSALNMLNDPTKNISTVEDPVEIQLPGITQVNINEKANMGFADALRAFLRQDPDILMLGEIRDLETAEIAIKAAQTGHMVLSTLHTNDAPATLTRLLNMGVPAFNVASAVQLIVAQRLVRKLCQHCRVETELPPKALLDAGFTETEIGTFTPFTPNLKGCPSCTEGYKGRAGVFQVMPISDHIKTLIMEGCTEKDIEVAAQKEGTIDLRRSGLIKVKEGVTSLEEIERVTNV